MAVLKFAGDLYCVISLKCEMRSKNPGGRNLDIFGTYFCVAFFRSVVTLHGDGYIHQSSHRMYEDIPIFFGASNHFSYNENLISIR